MLLIKHKILSSSEGLMLPGRLLGQVGSTRPEKRETGKGETGLSNGHLRKFEGTWREMKQILTTWGRGLPKGEDV